jgi:DNA-binding LytR/AlgR family response regulator
MNTYNCVVVDDMEAAIEVLEHHIKKMPQLILLKTFTNSPEALEFLEKNPVDIAFLDIQMPYLSGLELIEHLRIKLSDDLPSFVITTGYPEYALSGYEQGAIGYLLKPIIFKQFKTTIDRLIENWEKKAFNNISNQNDEYFFIESGGARVKMNYKDISYLESDGNYIKFVMGKNEHMIYNRPMRYLEAVLSDHGFIRVHKSFIISMNHIQALKGNKITINVFGEESKTIPVGTTYHEQVQKRIKIV